MNTCPCNSGKKYIDCCEPIIINQSAHTALTLMRSRYTAHYNINIDYLYNTTHQKNKDLFGKLEIEKWATDNRWSNLQIISAEHGRISDDRGIVEFKATYFDKNGKEHIHHEKSTFVKENEKWYYFDGIMNPPKINLMKKVSRNDPCPCGSGMKHKKCCG